MSWFTTTDYGPWSVVGLLVLLMVTALWRGKVVPSRTVDRLLAQQQQITDMHKETAIVERQRADVQQGDLVKLMQELTEALRRSKPAAS